VEDEPGELPRCLGHALAFGPDVHVETRHWRHRQLDGRGGPAEPETDRQSMLKDLNPFTASCENALTLSVPGIQI
jgi:hypothetical protein